MRLSIHQQISPHIHTSPPSPSHITKITQSSSWQPLLQEAMESVWSWITSLPSSTNWPSSDAPLSLIVAASADKSILLKAERTAGSDSDTIVTFSVSLHGFQLSNPNPSKTLWVSNPFPLSSPSTHLSLLIQLLEEVILLSPYHTILPSHSPAPKLSLESISAAMDACRTESVSAFFTLSLLCRLFWLCAIDAPADAGFLFFRSIDASNIEYTLDLCKPAMRAFVAALGVDREERLMRSLGYMLTKWSILRQLQTGTKATSMPVGCCPSFVVDAHGLWTLKGYAPIQAMSRVNGAADGAFNTKDLVLRYAIAHRQLEAVVQLEYLISLQDPRFIRVSVRVDNVRLHIVRLGFGKKDEEYSGEDHDNNMESERHFPSRVRIWVGPEVGTAYATGPSLGRSTGNPEREFETTRTVKGNLGSAKAPGVKAKSRSSVRSRGRSWRWEQEVEGSTGVFEGVLCDGSTGAEAAGGAGVGMGRRYSGPGRAFSKFGGLVVAGDELAEGVSWRVGREMEGRVLKWRIGGRIWASYFPNEVKSKYFETRSVEWSEEVNLDLIRGC